MNQSELITFTNGNIGEIRGYYDHSSGTPWFLAGSVCRALGLKDAKRQIKTIKERFAIAGVGGTHTIHPLLQSDGGDQKTLFVSEQVLYELIFQSRKQKAVKFRAWVTTEVLPELRKYGQYRMTGKLIRKSLTDEVIDSGEQERMHNRGISNFSKLINKSLGLPGKNNRDELPPEMLEKIAHRENLVSAYLKEGLEYGQIKEALKPLFLQEG